MNRVDNTSSRSKVLLRLRWPIVLVVALLLAACGPATSPPAEQPGGQPAAPGQPQPDTQPKAAQPKSGGTLVLVNSLGDPPSFDVHQETTISVIGPIMPNYDGLLMFDPLDPSKIVGDLAERWEQSQDGRLYTFALRKGVKFHNGTPFTAADAKYSLERMISPPKGMVSPRRAALGAIERIEVPDATTLNIFLKQPSPSLLAILAQQRGMAMYSKAFLEEKGQEVMKKEIMGTGPYKLKDYVRGTSIELVKNPNYWMPGRPYLDGLKYFILPDPNTRLAAFRTGQLHIHGLSVSDAQALEKELAGKITIQRQQGISPQTFLLNTTREPFDDIRVRQAISMAIDREAGIKVLAQGDGDVSGHMPATGLWSLPREELAKLPGYATDKAAEIARAKQLLADAGYPNGFSVTLATRNASSYVDLSTFVKDQLAKIGVEGNITPFESAAIFDLFNKKDYAASPWSYGFSLDDPDSIFSEFYVCGSPRNYTGLCDDEMQRLFEQQSQTLDPVQRKKLVQELDRKAITQSAMIVLYFGRVRTGVWNQVKDYRVFPSSYNNVKMRDVWLDQ
ncbi:MAG: ABC transporter substrate-binding protein [Chloroflexi bacterium]|nr:ABC transporter substrate-binding protein [Chloroflexota bacterium]